MIFFYVDESGTVLGDKQSSYFLLAALAIPDNQLQLVDEKTSGLKRELISWAEPEDFELKIRDIRRGEKFFKEEDWPTRVAAIHRVAQLLSELPCHIVAVQVDKRDMPEYVSTHDDLYRLAFIRLLDSLEAELREAGNSGMLMLDMRSDMHSSVQDRRLVKAYRDWLARYAGQTQFVELPWFGFSAFYAGLQLADCAAYMVDFIANEDVGGQRRAEIREAYARFQHKVQLIRIP